MVLTLWQVRASDVEPFDPTEIYANEPTFFSFKVNHGGEFINCPGMKYVRGQVAYVDLVDSDEFSVHELDRMMQMIGYPAQEVMFYYYKIPTEDLNIGLKPLGNDKDVLGMIKYIQRFKVISVYTEHGITRLNTYFQPSISMSSVTLEEITDEQPGPSNHRLLQIGWQEHHEMDLDIGEIGNETVDDVELGKLNGEEICLRHRFCLRHIHQNMKAKWRGNLLKDLLWKCATATTVPSFERRMETVRKEDEDLHQWLKEIPPQHWSRAYFSERPQSDLLLNNLCEVFNKQLVGTRDKPIITCLEYIREYLMKRIAGVNKIIARAQGPLTPAATKTFTLIKTLANEFKKYQVNGPWGDQVAVDLNTKSCSCRRWQLSGMPCKHAVVCIWDYEKDRKEPKVPEQWVSKVYWLDTWKSVYQQNLEAINGRSEWIQSGCPTKLVAPKHHTQVGRPKKKRKKSAVELAEGISKEGKMVRKGTTVTCGKCKKTGHNSRTCKGQGSSQQAS